MFSDRAWPCSDRRAFSSAPDLLEVSLWDGRLDNRGELGARYADVDQPATDAALARAAYQHDGVAGLGRLVGDWSAVIDDRRAGMVVLASDFAGVRPLYYRIDRGRVCWATRIEALLDAVGTAALDEQFMAGYLIFGGYPNRTPYAGIASVPPGHAVSVRRDRVEITPFWSAPTQVRSRYADEREYDERFLALFREAVAVRLSTPAPVIAELSGGLDSSSVVCMADHLIRAGAVAAPALRTISYVHRGSTDAPFIHAVERHRGGKGVHVSLDSRPLFAANRPVGAMPHSTAPLHEAAVDVANADGATVFLTGQAGDLVLGNWLDDSLQVAGTLRQGRPGLAWRQAIAWSDVTKVPVPVIVGRAIAATLPLIGARTVERPVRAAQQMAMRFLSGSLLRRTGLNDAASAFVNDWADAPVERRAHFQALGMMRQLRALQPLESMQRLQYTHPFAHRPLIEFLMSVPADILCRPGQPRRLMRRALSSLWPAELRGRRSKSLFGGHYLEAFRPFAAALLRERRWHVVEHGWVERRPLVSALERIVGRLDCDQHVRSILLLENWLRRRSQCDSQTALVSSASCS